MIRPVVLAAALLLGGCGVDRSITHGADGAREWDRHLRAAVPLGMEEPAVRSLMRRNGFRCQARPTHLWCDKWSRRAIVRRRWIATFEVRDGRVAAVRANTGLVGP